MVTGGAGYIGSHAAKALRKAGHRVVIYDNLSAGHREAALGAPLIEGDTADVDTVRRAIRDSGATAVMHFAAWLSVPDSVRDPAGYYRNNVTGTIGVLEAMGDAVRAMANAIGPTVVVMATFPTLPPEHALSITARGAEPLVFAMGEELFELDD